MNLLKKYKVSWHGDIEFSKDLVLKICIFGDINVGNPFYKNESIFFLFFDLVLVKSTEKTDRK